jgi:hypothetical protein
MKHVHTFIATFRIFFIAFIMVVASYTLYKLPTIDDKVDRLTLELSVENIEHTVSAQVDILNRKYDQCNEALHRIEQMLNAGALDNSKQVHASVAQRNGARSQAVLVDPATSYPDLYDAMTTDPVGFATMVRDLDTGIEPLNWESVLRGLADSHQFLAELESGKHAPHADLFYQTFSDHLAFLDQHYANKPAVAVGKLPSQHATKVRMALEEHLKLAAAQQVLVRSRYE